MCLNDCGNFDRRTVIAAAAATVVGSRAHAKGRKIIGRSVNWRRDDDIINGHLAFTRKDQPIVVVLHGNAGLPADVKATADLLAANGFVGFAVDPTSRYPDPAQIPRSLLRGRQFGDDCVADARAGLAYLRNLGFRSDRLAVLGYCGGGYIGLLWGDSANGIEIDAFVGIHAPMRNHTPQGIDHERPQGIDLYRNLRAPAQFHYGAADELTPAPDIAAQRALARRNGKTLETFVYPDAHHGFALSTDPQYRPAAARLVDLRAIRFLRRLLA